MKQENNTFKLIEMSLYAALIVVAISFKIPLPSALSNSFVHCGNALVALSILLMGFRRGLVASSLGLFVFDVTYGYANEAIFVVMESVLVLLIMEGVYRTFFKRQPSQLAVLVLGLVAAISKVVIIYWEFVIGQMFLGNPLKQAMAVALTGMPASVFTAIATAILVPLLFYPMSKIVGRYHPIGQ
ncbi:ECF transporter S component [Vaginisenegalia massiliensis]|uniref:ECF transporter S component n=1 Tax=Vaginisenegalia massiliensis TaxID=2058294 RepID=UPI000F525BB1|nr:ECF transporter S component [Vaginisenegalia massiliensis]